MAKFAKIENGAVTSVIVSVAAFNGHDVPVPENLRVSVGTGYADGIFSAEETPAVAPPEADYASLTKLEAMGLFRQITGMDDAGELLMRKDAALELLWMKWSTDVPQSIRRDNPAVSAFLDGLVAAGHATEAHRAAMLANWPTAE
jgi:hypothetical protein